MSAGTLAIIPARGRSKGLPGKNVRPLAGLPLIAHAILFADLCAEVDRTVVTTEAPVIADAARRFGAEVVERPVALARDETPIWPVLRHALEHLERDGARFDRVLLLDPTTPLRLPSDLECAFRRLDEAPAADGAIGVSQPDFNPIWHCVTERDGWMTDLFPEGAGYERRQDVPPVYRINGSLYLWRAEFVRAERESWRRGGRHVISEIPDFRAISIDTLEEFRRAELLITAGLVTLPWLSGVVS